uniref:ATP synthase F0 subunit 6 n=1 Tax=Laemobothrion tinnunculi TaxID=1941263 RepID=UPI0021D52601|nr:ATP synthase F0 subunit 6 [Laemobothrion tinnunculi]UXC94706.1 ATP synthase F0 subunit 6 [Laemobothrion tinnunculi]UXC94719.1 ATP synthase F0 subunit 6 [Laemobothrion tinnunculi]
MVTSLFSVFDPCSYSWNMNYWPMLFLSIIMMSTSYWSIPSSTTIFLSMITKLFNLSNKQKKYNNIYLISTVYMVFILNYQNLIPLSFSFFSHLVFSLSITIPAWWYLMFKQLKFSWLKVASHFLPLSTPKIMIFLIIPIEFIGVILRPLTLGLRLTMNTMIGHMMLGMLKSLYMPMFFFYEAAVMIIQTWVILLLLISYMKEYEN